MNEERNINSIEGIRRHSRKLHPDCPICTRIPVTVVSTPDLTSTKEAIKAVDQAIESLEAIKEEDRLHHGGILQQWKEIENLINQPLRRNNGRN